MFRRACAAVVFSRLATAAGMPRLKAGAFAQDVTPTKFPISVNGNMPASGKGRE